MARPRNEDDVAQLPMVGGSLRVYFENLSSLQSQQDMLVKQQGLFVHTRAEPRPFCEFELHLELPDGTQCDVIQARCVQVHAFGENPGMMVQLMRVPASLAEQVSSALKSDDDPTDESDSEPDEESASFLDWDDNQDQPLLFDEGDDVSLNFEPDDDFQSDEDDHSSFLDGDDDMSMEDIQFVSDDEDVFEEERNSFEERNIFDDYDYNEADNLDDDDSDGESEDADEDEEEDDPGFAGMVERRKRGRRPDELSWTGGAGLNRVELLERLREMTPSERSRLAKRANRVVRSILIRDNEPLIIFFLLKNPHITRAEVIELSKMPTLNHQSITAMLGNRQWAGSEELRYNLVRNPKTPMNIALKLVNGLNMKHLRELAKDWGMKTQIKQLALRLVQQRGEG